MFGTLRVWRPRNPSSPNLSEQEGREGYLEEAMVLFIGFRKVLSALGGPNGYRCSLQASS